jgi:polar amino acid transport system substrate-binding protein
MHSKLIASVTVAALMLAGPVLAQEVAIPKQSVNEQLRARLPENIRADGKMISVNNGSFPPYEIVTGTEMTGASDDLDRACHGRRPASVAGRHQFWSLPVRVRSHR